MPRLILVRHGQTAWNAEQRYQRQSDLGLDAAGQQEAAALGDRLAAERIDFDNAPLRQAWLTSLGWQPPDSGGHSGNDRATGLERLADAVETALNMEMLERIIWAS